MYLYGAGQWGKDALNVINCAERFKIEGIIDKYKAGSELDGFEIILLDEADRNSDIIICVSNYNEVKKIYIELRHYGFTNIYLFHNVKYCDTGFFIQDYCKSCKPWGDAEDVLPYIEMHAIDFCNLNCRGCSHFSAIFEKTLPDDDKRLEDIRKIGIIFPHIIQFTLLGGEPLLNPNLDKYIYCARESMPNAKLSIITNGLLIPSCSSKVLEAIKECCFRINISEYEPTSKMLTLIEGKLKEHGIPYEVWGNQKNSFNKPFSMIEGKYPQYCLSDGCVNVWNGKIAKCPSLMYIDNFNKYFEQNLPNDGIVNLDTAKKAKEYIDVLNKKVPLCKYCVRNEIDWEICGNKPRLDDFSEI